MLCKQRKETESSQEVVSDKICCVQFFQDENLVLCADLVTKNFHSSKSLKLTLSLKSTVTQNTGAPTCTFQSKASNKATRNWLWKTRLQIETKQAPTTDCFKIVLSVAGSAAQLKDYISYVLYQKI